jgi:hypothetical protein
MGERGSFGRSERTGLTGLSLIVEQEQSSGSAHSHAQQPASIHARIPRHFGHRHDLRPVFRAIGIDSRKFESGPFDFHKNNSFKVQQAASLLIFGD